MCYILYMRYILLSFSCCLENSSFVNNVVAIIIIAQLHLTNPELRLCACSNPARCVLELCDFENLWQWCRLFRKNNSSPSFIPSEFIMGRINVGPCRTVLNLQSWAEGFRLFFSNSSLPFQCWKGWMHIRKSAQHWVSGKRIERSLLIFSSGLCEMFPDINYLKETYFRLKTKSNYAVSFHLVLLKVCLNNCWPSWSPHGCHGYSNLYFEIS